MMGDWAVRSPLARPGGGLAWTLVAAAIAFRATRYLAGNSLEVAESELALNLVHRPFGGLLQPLDYDQGAPLGFLWAAKLAVQLFGPHEWALRLFPFLAGIASVFLFKALAERCLDRFGATLALALFAVSPMVMWYSVQVKQYSVDVAIACGLLLVARECEVRGVSVRTALSLAAAGLVAIPFSHPAVFTLGGAGAVLVGAAIRSGDRRAVRLLAAVGATWGAAFAALYVLFLRQLGSNAYLLDYWAPNLMPFPPRRIAELRWFPTTFFGMFVDPAGFELAAALAAFLFVVGIVHLAGRDRTLLGMLALPILLALAASAAHEYPFGRRLILFLVPALVLLIAAGASRLREATAKAAAWVAPIALALLLFEPVFAEAHALVRPRRHEDMRPAVVYLKEHWRPDDTLYLYYDAQYAFRFYAERLGVAAVPAIVGRSSESVWEDDLRDLEATRGRGRVWFLFSHIHQEGGPASEERFFLVHLERSGRRLDRFQAGGVSLHLFELDD